MFTRPLRSAAFLLYFIPRYIWQNHWQNWRGRENGYDRHNVFNYDTYDFCRRARCILHPWLRDIFSSGNRHEAADSGLSEAVPLFVFVGDLMDRGGISKRMIKWAESLLGWLPGGLGIVTIVSCAIFAALTGSGPATVAAIGSIMIPSLVKNGYPIKTAAGMAHWGRLFRPVFR